jgi:SAM-dependent methyltransferase
VVSAATCRRTNIPTITQASAQLPRPPACTLNTTSSSTHSEDLVLCPFNTTRENLRILDVGSADGWFLHNLRREFTHPDTATLIGTDIAPYPDAVEQIVIHDFRTPFSAEWKGTFDFVQLRAVLANVPGEAGVDLVQRAVELLRPGGWIQIVDGSVPSGQILASDKPSARLVKYLGNMLLESGMDGLEGPKAASLLRAASVTDIGSKQANVRLGKGSEIEETSWKWIRGFTNVVGTALVKRGTLSQADMDQLTLDVFEEVKAEGFSMPWFAAWGRKA